MGTQIQAARLGVDKDVEHWSVVQLQEEGVLKDSFWDIGGHRIGGREVEVAGSCVVEPGQRVELVGPQPDLVLYLSNLS